MEKSSKTMVVEEVTQAPRENPKRLLDVIEETSEKMRNELIQRLEGQREMLLDLRLRCLATKKSFTRIKGKEAVGGSRRRCRKKNVEKVEEWDDTPLVMDFESVSEGSGEERGGPGCNKKKYMGICLRLDLTRVTPAKFP